VSDDGDPQETIDLIGDDGIIGRVVVPRVWHLPSRPARGIKVRDRDGLVWHRPDRDPDFVDLWHAEGMKILRWSTLLERGPLTEVL
jgi:hypothetical protein